MFFQGDISGHGLGGVCSASAEMSSLLEAGSTVE